MYIRDDEQDVTVHWTVGASQHWKSGFQITQRKPEKERLLLPFLTQRPRRCHMIFYICVDWPLLFILLCFSSA
jgi:hypothetical protein